MLADHLTHGKVIRSLLLGMLALLTCSAGISAQERSPAAEPTYPTVNSAVKDRPADNTTTNLLLERIVKLEDGLAAASEREKKLLERLDKLERERADNPSASRSDVATSLPAADINQKQTSDQVPQTISKEDRENLDFFRGSTVNVMLDGYYGYNFNRPVGRVNLLRAYDVLSNAFSLNQATFVFERAPNVDEGRRFGARIDLQFGQATDTLQGNPANEPRPQIYRHVFQAYGTYVAPVKRGLTVDIGKWASSLGLEGNYNKDQMNYSRSYWFNFLPFYHMGVRANLKLNDRVAFSYWITNGTQQTEPFNSFKDQMFGMAIQPAKNVSWTAQYYLGQEHPDVVPIPNPGPAPVQPGLSFAPIKPSPDGRLHIFDTYLTWQTTPKLTLAFEADYVIQRLWRKDAPGQPSLPAHVTGGSAYVRYQFNPKLALTGRGEYLADIGGMFSGITQDLKEHTLTLDYKPQSEENFLIRLEWRRDFSNQRYFLTRDFGVFSKQQNTATIGLIWWWGRKQGAW